MAEWTQGHPTEPGWYRQRWSYYEHVRRVVRKDGELVAVTIHENGELHSNKVAEFATDSQWLAIELPR